MHRKSWNGEAKSALAAAAPGDTIQLTDGTYTGNFQATKAATSGSGITLTGSSRAALTSSGGGLTGANYDDSWVDVKGNHVLVENHTGTRTTSDGHQTHTHRSGVPGP